MAGSDDVWDGESWRKVHERYMEREPEVMAEVERLIDAKAPAHRVAWTVVQAILRGPAYVLDRKDG